MAEAHQSLLPFGAVIFDVDDDFDLGIASAIDDKVEQKLQRIQRIAAAADQNAQLFALNIKDQIIFLLLNDDIGI